jgi:hypothetical protein
VVLLAMVLLAMVLLAMVLLAMVLLAMVLALSAMPIILTRVLERRLQAAATAADGVAPLAAGLRGKVRFILMPGTHAKISEAVKRLRRSESFLLQVGAMTKPFRECSLDDLIPEIQEEARHHPGQVLDAITLNIITDLFRDRRHCDTILTRHPSVRGGQVDFFL